MNSFRISPTNLLQTLSMALDLAVSGVYAHQARTGIISGYIARTMGLPLEDQHKLLVAALVHDIGAAPHMDERMRLIDPHQEKELGNDIFIHAEAGYALLKSSSRLFQSIAETVRYHHDAWSGGNPSGLAGERIPLHSRIIHLADRVEVLTDKQEMFYEHKVSLPPVLKTWGGSKFDPAVVEAFMECAQKDTLWLDLANHGYHSLFVSQVDLGQADISAQELLDVAFLFAKIIDRTSIFTASHSINVANVSVMLGELCGFCQTELYLLRIAGLLHDLGKLSVPNSILEKPGPLTSEERAIIRQHPYYTYRVLERIDPDPRIARWAAFHHETPDGCGYPFGLRAEEIPLGAKIVAVADFFVALAENRPYRISMGREAISTTLRETVGRNKIDARIVEMLLSNYQTARALVMDAAWVADNHEAVCLPETPDAAFNAPEMQDLWP